MTCNGSGYDAGSYRVMGKAKCPVCGRWLPPSIHNRLPMHSTRKAPWGNGGLCEAAEDAAEAVQA